MRKINNIAVIGVDGTGKSTVIEIIKKHYKDSCKIQYMGYRAFEDNAITELHKKNKKSIFDKVKLIWGIYWVYKKRVKDNKNFDGVVIYDRYVDEIYINASGIMKIVYTLIYKYLFPRPDAKVYLFCNVETSFSRKEDIIDKDAFVQMKNRFDKEYIKNSKVFIMNSDKCTSNELAKRIIKLIDKGKSV